MPIIRDPNPTRTSPGTARWRADLTTGGRGDVDISNPRSWAPPLAPTVSSQYAGAVGTLASPFGEELPAWRRLTP